MMNKQEAIEWVKEIQTGNFDRNEIVSKMPRGSVAVNIWDEVEFSYGMEYGVIMAVMKIFNLDKIE